MRRYSISQMDLFDYTPNTEIGDLNRLIVCLEQINFAPLINSLNSIRGNGRNDFPNALMLRIFVWQFLSRRLDVASIRRDLSANPALRDIVGLNDARNRFNNCSSYIPSDKAFSNFIANLSQCHNPLDTVYSDLRERVFLEIPEYGTEGAGDGKYFDSYAPNKHEKHNKTDHRGEHDATYSIKVVSYSASSGETHSKKETHYGFRKHTIVDVKTELPIASVLLPANIDEKLAMKEYVLPSIPDHILRRMKYISFDRGYDSTEFLNIIRTYGIKPIIDKRIIGERTKLHRYKDTNIYYTEEADVYMKTSGKPDDDEFDPETGLSKCFERMKFRCYDASKGSKDDNGVRRGALIYTFKNSDYTIDINEESRFFSEVSRDSKKFSRLYNHRTSVERYHGRQDTCFGFETHTIRGLKKMRAYVSMGDIIMLALALAHKKKGQKRYASIYDFGFIDG